ncbi:hypothetical protein [Pseudomonas urmiensis]|uniref:hypothetical protein n=1 Tax=Pseudomonas urmiensis TaxID=2745493 RepID=UPI0034D56067
MLTDLTIRQQEYIVVSGRHRILAGVSWNGQSQEAFFFNPDGLAIPLRASRT